MTIEAEGIRPHSARVSSLKQAKCDQPPQQSRGGHFEAIGGRVQLPYKRIAAQSVPVSADLDDTLRHQQRRGKGIGELLNPICAADFGHLFDVDRLPRFSNFISLHARNRWGR
jgi:hypothetical protein